jgi:hypothetical protein
MPEKPGFIGLRLSGDGRRVNTNAVGVKVRITASESGAVNAPQPQFFEVNAGNGFAGQSMSWILAGLGRYKGTVDAEIWWTDGRVDRLTHLAQGTYYSVVYGMGAHPAGIPGAVK